MEVFKKFEKQKLRVTPQFETGDTFLTLFICIVSFATHLWTIQSPSNIVFDEVHFGNFTNWYTRSEFFFDIHPPLGKLVMFLFANLSEYDGLIEFGDNAGPHPYDNDANFGSYIPLRLTPALFSSCCSPLLYLALRFSSFSKCAAFAGASLCLFDTSLLCEHRYILSDGLLHFFTCLHIMIMSYGLSIPRYTIKFWIWQIITGLSLGAACSCKNTAWGLCALNAFIHILELVYDYQEISFDLIFDIICRGAFLVFPLILVYFVSFIIHFILTPYSGQGTGYLPEDMKQQLVEKADIGHEAWSVRVKGSDLFTRAIRLTVIMHTGNMQITQFHPYQSRPLGWPLLTDIKVAFYFKDQLEVSCMGNVFSYYFVFFGTLALLFGYKNEKWFLALRFTVGWAVSYLPFFLIPRAMYLYHYHIPLMLGALAFGASLDIFIPKYYRGFFTVIACFLVLVGFVLWCPYTYGIPSWDKKVTIWNNNWNEGDKVHKELASLSKKSDSMDTKNAHIV